MSKRSTKRKATVSKAGQRSKRLKAILGTMARLATEYYTVTEKPIGITGELAEYHASEILGLNLSAARTEGLDATDGTIRFQIKGRRLVSDLSEGQIGKFNCTTTWDWALLVVLGEKYEPIKIYAVPRTKIIKALNNPGSVSRNIRRQLSPAKFRSLAEKDPIWTVGKKPQRPWRQEPKLKTRSNRRGTKFRRG